MRPIASNRRHQTTPIAAWHAFGLVTAALAQTDIPLQLLRFNPTTGSLQPASSLPSNQTEYYRLGINVGIAGGAPQTYLFADRTAPVGG